MIKLERISFKNSKGQKLAGKLWTPANYKHTIILANGIGNAKEAWEKIISWPNELAKLNYRVLTFDFRGRGESEGEFIETTLTTNIDDLKSAMNFLDSDVLLIGQSFGGATSICIAAKDKRAKVLVTRSAALNLDEWQGGERLAEAKKKGYAIGAAPWKKYSLELFESARKHKIIEQARKIKIPWLIIHGGRDTVVPVRQAKELYAAAKCPKELAIIKGADHTFSVSKNVNAEAFSMTVNWLKRWLK